MILATLIFFAVAVGLFLKYVYSYWSRKGFPYLKPNIPLGNFASVARRERSFGMAIYDLYTKSKEPFVGIYLFFRPALLIRDAELAKNILTKDFYSFHDRGVYCNEKKYPLSAGLFSIEGKDWKDLRTKLTPTFTSGKLKSMFATIEDVAAKVTVYLQKELPKEGKIIDMKELLSSYALDIIASVIFGLEINSIGDPNHKFREIGHIINGKDFMSVFRQVANFTCPKLIDILHINPTDSEVEAFMIDIVKKTIDYREQNNYSRKDLMQLIIQLRNTGEVSKDGDWNVNSKSEKAKLMSIEQCAAQVLLFYIAGFETSASATSLCLYELTQNEDVMQKLLEDIDETLSRHNGEVTYDSIQDMKYLELCIMETVRKYPALPLLNRECTKQFPIPGSNLTIEKGTSIIISMMGLHRDPQYFPDPLKFYPERFDKDIKDYDENAYMPFGEGPRNCIAYRLGKLNAKVGIVTILKNFKCEASQKKEIEFDNYAVALMPKGGVNIRLKRIAQ